MLPLSAAAARTATRIARHKTSATTPYVPMRLSRMISSLRNLSCPPPNPSAQSAIPSSCIAPVNRISASVATMAAIMTFPVRTSVRYAGMIAIPAINSPTNGQHQTDRAIATGRKSHVAETGTRLKRASARQKSATGPFGAEMSSSCSNLLAMPSSSGLCDFIPA